MKAFVVATPLFDAAMSVQAYQLQDRSGDSLLDMNQGYNRMAEAFNTSGLDLVAQLGVEPFSADKPVIASLNRFQLLTGAPTNMPIAPERLICLFPADLPPEKEVLERLDILNARGYRIALNGFPQSGQGNPLFPFIHDVLLDYSENLFNVHHLSLRNNMKNLRILITNIPDIQTYEKLRKSDGEALFSGNFYKQPITQGVNEIAPIKVNALQLLRNVNEPDFELDEIVKIIERDPSLSISLLKSINSGAVGLRNKVDSIRSAVAILGQTEVRRWATVAISIGLGEDRPGEITRVSLIRAKFAENLALLFELGIFQNNLFIAGLFSLLDVILQKPMSEAMNEVAVDDRVRRVLMDKQGEFAPVMELIYSYERAEWDEVNRIMVLHNLTVEGISAAFIDALVWYDQLLRMIDDEGAAED